MILVTTGSYGFSRLIKVVDELVGEEKIKDEVIAQISGSSYTPRFLNYFKYSSDILGYMERADVVISHGGAGSIIELLMLKKKIIAVPNRDLADDHQYPLMKKLSDKGSLLFCPELSGENLLAKINLAVDFVPSEYSIVSKALISDLQKELSSW